MLAQLMVIRRTVGGPNVPTSKGTEESFSYVKCFLYLVSFCKFMFKVYFIDYAITVVLIFFSPLPPSSLHPATLQHSTTLSSYPWVVHISSLTSLFQKL